MRTNTPRVAVVGAGFGGLAASIELATAGCDVEVVELAGQVGGKAGTARVDGAEFDTGPSLLTLPDVPARLFALAGEDMGQHVTLRRLSPAFRYHFPDGARLDVHDDLETTLHETTLQFGSQAAVELRAFADYAMQIWRASAPAFVFGDAPALRTILGLDVRTVAGLRHIDAMRTMQRAIEARVRDPRLRRVLLRYATYNGSDARRAPATLNCIAAVELGLGGFGVQGGIGALARELGALAERVGVRFRFSTAVSEVLLRGGRVCGLRLEDGSTLHADTVVSNADASHLHRRLLPPAARPPRTPDAPSMSGYNAVLRVRRGGPGEREGVAHRVIFCDDYLDEFGAIFDRGEVTAAPTVYACHQGLAHGRAGWDDADALFTMINAPSVGQQRRPLDQGALRERVCEALRGVGAIGEDDHVVWERTPHGLATRFPGSDGALYGAASNDARAAFRRPANRSPWARGLYLASGTAHPGGGVPLAMLSGSAAARALLADQRLPCATPDGTRFSARRDSGRPPCGEAVSAY